MPLMRTILTWFRRHPDRIQNLAFALCLGAAVLFALWKVPFGFGGGDEAFYLTIPRRLTMGDWLFRDEWHLSQLSGVLNVPFVWLFRTLSGGTDGILIAARYVYVAFHALVGLCFYVRLRDCGWWAGAAGVCYFLFTPYDIMALSYNTMGLDFLLLSGVLFATAKGRAPLLLSGLCLAACVLCCPYLAGAYLLYAGALGLRRLRARRRPAGPDEILVPSRLLWLTVGAGLAAAGFLGYLLSTCGISGVLLNLPEMLRDPEHPPLSLSYKLGRYFKSVVWCHEGFPWVLACYALMLLVLTLDRRRGRHRGRYLIVSCALSLVTGALFGPQLMDTYYNAVLFPLIFVSVSAYLLCENKPKSLFAGVFLGGAAYSLAVCLGSNQYFYMISAASAVSNTAGLLFLGRVLKEMRDSPEYPRRGYRAALAAAMALLAGVTFRLAEVKYTHCFWEESLPELTARIEDGPARGVRTTQYKADKYQMVYDDLEELCRDLPPGKLLCLTGYTPCFLMQDRMECASFSAWMSGETPLTLNRLCRYYELNPAKVPDYIYLPDTSQFDRENVIAGALDHGYRLTRSENGCMLVRA